MPVWLNKIMTISVLKTFNIKNNAILFFLGFFMARPYQVVFIPFSQSSDNTACCYHFIDHGSAWLYLVHRLHSQCLPCVFSL